jgi:predicted XRE-type DNA-binding protein
MAIQQHDHSCHKPGECRRNQWIDPAVWQREDMRLALARRDIATVYRLLQRYGLSQRAIAALAGQSQSEVSEVIAGRRRVLSYELLVRIAVGLGVPRGWMGLAYDASPSDVATPSDGAA